MAAFAAAAVLIVQSPAPVAAADPTPAQRVIAIAESELGKPWRFAAEGPNAFDCSGLVLYAFQHAGYGDRIGGGHSALGMYRWFAARGLASRTNPQVGDLVIYGGGSHVGIYIGDGRVISTLVRGVRIHGVYALHGRFTAFLHTGLSGTAVPSAPSATSSPVSAATTPPVSAWRITTTSLRLRAGASANATVEAVLAPGTKLAVLGSARAHGQTWYHVRAAGRLGWVAAGFTRAP